MTYHSSFSASDVLMPAILSGERTELRVLITPQPEYVDNSWHWNWPIGENPHGMLHNWPDADTFSRALIRFCPYGWVNRVMHIDSLWAKNGMIQLNAISVERLQAISEAAALAEGFDSWAANPWVWVIKLTRCK